MVLFQDIRTQVRIKVLLNGYISRNIFYFHHPVTEHIFIEDSGDDLCRFTGVSSKSPIFVPKLPKSLCGATEWCDLQAF